MNFLLQDEESEQDSNQWTKIVEDCNDRHGQVLVSCEIDDIRDRALTHPEEEDRQIFSFDVITDASL